VDLERCLRSDPGLIRRLAEAGPSGGKPLSAKIKLLWRCNLRCSFCILPAAVPDMPGDRACALVKRLSEAGCAKVHFSGGELFLHPDIDSILECAASTGMQVNCTTNGTLLDKEYVARLERLGIHSVTVSLDGPDASTHDKLRGVKGSFKTTVKALRLLARRKLRLQVNTVALRSNAAALEATGAFLYALDPTIRWNILPVNTARASRMINAATALELYRRASSWPNLSNNPFPATVEEARLYARGWYGFGEVGCRPRCYAPWIGLFITPDGAAFPCCKGHSTFEAWGSALAEPIASLCESPKARALRAAMTGDVPPAACKRCCEFGSMNAVVRKTVRRECGT
jgi:MoaA/NifB/PqqE/SkfB family radical SAM enzyme